MGDCFLGASHPVGMKVEGDRESRRPFTPYARVGRLRMNLASVGFDGRRQVRAGRYPFREARTGLEDAPRVQDPEWIECRLDRPHDPDRVRAALDLQPLAPGTADAVLTRDGAAKIKRGLV